MPNIAPGRRTDLTMPARLEQIHHWLRHTLGITDYVLAPASADASFRRYFRITGGGQSGIVMDAPPDKEGCAAYIDIAARLKAAGVHAPAILEQDLEQGFLLLSDLGTVLYLDALTEDNSAELYDDALAALAKIQHGADARGLPPYEEALLRREMMLFPDWLLGRHLHIELTPAQQEAMEQVFTLLVASALAQPRVFVHRDYHSRNLMVCPGNNPGILDFQDAVAGPVTYDPVSLLKDCYIKWPRPQVINRALAFLRRSHEHLGFDDMQYLRWFDLMGVQRHLKASGIFARLYHRDHKAGYLKDIPRTLSYIQDLGPDYPELDPLVTLIGEQVLPGLEEASSCAP